MKRSTQHAFEPEEIMAYLDGELEAHQAAALASHLEHCGECQAVAAQLRQVSERLLDFQIEPSPAKLDFFVHGQIASFGEGQEITGSAKRGLAGVLRKFVPKSPIGWSAAVGAVALLVIGAVVALSRLEAPIPTESVMREQVNLAVLPATPPPPPASHGRTVTGLQTLANADIAPDANGNFHGLGDHAEGIVGGGAAGKFEPKKGQGIEAPEIRGPMIVQTAAITILAQNYDQASGQIQPLTSARGGYVQDMTADTRTGTARSVSATLRVPDKQLEGFLADLRKLGHVEQETRNNREVTDAYIDLTARLKTARATEQRVLDLLGTRTGKLSDVLEAEQELARIRGEIESMDGQRVNMEHQVRYATVQVQLSEEYREQLNPESFSTGRRLRNSLVEGLANLAGGITGAAIFVFAYGPSILFWLALLGIPAWFIWRHFGGTQKKDSNQTV